MTRRWIPGAAFLAAAALLVPALSGPFAVAESEEPVVLEPVGKDAGPRQDPAQVAARVAGLTQDDKKLGKQAATVIIDAEDGQTLYDDDGSLQLIPASTNKIPTSVAALRLMGANKTLQTRVTQAGGEVFLIGGGDPLLASRRRQGRTGVPGVPAGHLHAEARERHRPGTAGAKGATAIALKVDDTFSTVPRGTRVGRSTSVPRGSWLPCRR